MKTFKNEYVFPYLNDYEIIGLTKFKSHFKAITPNSIIEFDKNKILKIEYPHFLNKKILQYTENDFFKIFLLQNSKNKSSEVHIEDLKSKEQLFMMLFF
ncbi:MAG: hypothetical protein HC854_03375 [Flavobacterium sp.]|nr:hypothetical protein [Flavobacterium sp.]